MPPRKKKVPAKSVGLDAKQVSQGEPPKAVTDLIDRITDDGGSALTSYRDPFGEHWLILASLPIDQVKPTPFQRQLSDTHTKKLEAVIPKIGRFLDPLIVVRHDKDGGGYWTPNGMHRLEAMNRLGAKSVMGLVVPDREVAFRILALNTEKAHNLKDKSLEVVRMATLLSEEDGSKDLDEATWEFEFEEPAFLTIGWCYEEKARFSGGVYQPVVKRCEQFLPKPIGAAIEIRKARAAKLLALDEIVVAKVKELKEAGFESSYLKGFVVARINPLRFKRTKKDSLPDFDETIDKMRDKAEAFDIDKVKATDIAAAAG